MTAVQGDEPFRWETLVPHIIHPTKVMIIEALLWIDQLLSPTDLKKIINDPAINLSHISYHVRKLAEAGAIKPVSTRLVRGATETFYFFT